MSRAPRVWMPLPDRDFDTTEVAVPWRVLTDAGIEVVFATEAGAPPETDPLLLSGVIFGQLGAAPEVKAIYAQLREAAAFRAPVPWGEIDPGGFDGLWLAGGHAPGMRQYLGAAALQAKVRGAWARLEATGQPVGAICHGVLVLARAGVLSGRTTTCLPRYMEQVAYSLTAWRLGDYYRTYPAYVEEEVRATGCTFVRGPIHLVTRGTERDDRAAFVVEDRLPSGGRYLSARWPGDAWKAARAFRDAVLERVNQA